MNNVKFYCCVLYMVIVSIGASYGQKTTIYLDSDADFRTGLELFQKQKYGAAQQHFEKVISSPVAVNSLLKTDAEYYAGLCALELFNKDAELRLKRFIREHPENAKTKWAYFQLGKYNYRKKNYQDATEWFEKTDAYDLTDEERSEFYFKRGYSYFMLEQTERAKKDFYELKDIDTKYSAPANYYYSHIAYGEKNYQTALEGFLRLTRNESFGAIVPYYIAQLYYLQSRYDSVISYATPMLDSANVKRAPEIARLIGESYYRTNRYKEAIPFLKKYEKSVYTLSRDDKYELGYAYYKTNDIDNAIVYFIYASEYEDSTAQNAHYHLADCYLKKNNKKAALEAFRAASRMDYDVRIKEDALFSYAKLCYEIDFNPYNEAISAFRLYIGQYSESTRIDEAYGYLVNVFLSTKNYKEALHSIESIKNMSIELKSAYQKIAYNRGVELYNNMALDSALRYFEKALVYKYDKSINALCHYWKGEVLYRKKMFAEAINHYQLFVTEPGAINLPEFELENYNVAYCYFQQKNYPEASLWFRKYINAHKGEPNNKLNDAYVRTGDCYYIARDFSNAVDFYDQAIAQKKTDVDYAYYQKAICLGVLRKTEGKINALLALLTNYPNSNFSPTAKFELANTYFNNGDYDLALPYYQKIVTEHSRSNFLTKAILKTGLVYYNKKDDDQALGILKKLVADYPNDIESRNAIPTVQQIYVSKGNLDDFKKWIETIPFANISKASLDSSEYEIAKNHYYEGNCEKATADFTKYLNNYPDGIFVTEVNYFKGDCYFRTDNYKEALAAYQHVIEKPTTTFTEQALVNSAWINFYKEKNYSAANSNYVQMENIAQKPENLRTARTGQMRCNFIFKNYDAASKAARSVISTDKIPQDILSEAHFIIAKSAFETENYDLAMEEFKIATETSRNESAVEAKYYIAYIQHLKTYYAESKKTIFELIKQSGSYKYWITKSLILLADNYLALADKFQAKTTLKSVIEDADIPELVTIAQGKLDKIIEMDKPKVEKLPQDQLKIDLNENLEDTLLFLEELKAPGKQ